MAVENARTKATNHLLQEADKIIAMAHDLRDRGYLAEAAFFALMAAQRLRLVRCFQNIDATLEEAALPCQGQQTSYRED